MPRVCTLVLFIIFSGAGDSNQRYALLMTAKKTKQCYTELLHFIFSLHHMVELAHVVKGCSDLTIYASGLSQPEKLMDSLSNKYIDITQLENVSARL